MSHIIETRQIDAATLTIDYKADVGLFTACVKLPHRDENRSDALVWVATASTRWKAVYDLRHQIFMAHLAVRFFQGDDAHEAKDGGDGHRGILWRIYAEMESLDYPVFELRDRDGIPDCVLAAQAAT